jgi:hypothetical protein
MAPDAEERPELLSAAANEAARAGLVRISAEPSAPPGGYVSHVEVSPVVKHREH